VSVSSLHPTTTAGPWHPPSWPRVQHWFISSLPKYQPDFPTGLNTLTCELLLFSNHRENVRLHCQLLWVQPLFQWWILPKRDGGILLPLPLRWVHLSSSPLHLPFPYWFVFTCVKPMGVCMDPSPRAGVSHPLAPSSPVFPSHKREKPIFLSAQREVGAHGSMGGSCGWGGEHSESSGQSLLFRLITDPFRRAEE